MKFSVSQSELSTALSVVSKGASKNSTLPILHGVLLRLDGANLVLQATNQVTSVEYTIPVLAEEAGGTVVPAKLFTDIVKSLPDAAVHVEVKDDEATVYCESSTFSVHAMNALDFPEFPKIDALQSMSLPFSDFSALVKKVMRNVSRDESRAILTGILIENNGEQIRMVATDSYRVAITDSDSKVSDTGFRGVISGSFLSTIAALPSSDEEITLALSDMQVMISYRNTTFISRVIEGNYPNYRPLLPKGYSTRVVFERNQLVGAVKRISLLSGNSAPVKLEINSEANIVKLYTQTQDVGDAQEVIQADVEGESVSIGFNFSYILDGLNAMSGGEVAMELEGASRPGIFKSSEDRYLYLIMPLRLYF